jgi:integrase
MRKGDLIQGAYYRWLLGKRKGVFFADGRANRPALGRHSLATRDRREAIEAIRKLDLLKAVEAGRADRAMLGRKNEENLPLREGRELYAAHIARARVVGGARPTTAKRYRTVFDKFEIFAKGEGIATWNEVDHSLLERYAAHLDDQGYAYATEYLELTTLKQAVKWFIGEQKLPVDCTIHLPLKKPHGTTTYCWRPVEITAMIRHCDDCPKLRFLGDILLALACTGLRISELASLRWSDVDLGKNIVRLTDDASVD